MAIDGHILEVILRLPALLLGIGFHEFAHAYTAWKLGDPTPEADERLSLNPLCHLSVIGTAMIFFGPFGWGRAVRVNPANFRDPTRDMMRVAIAGPFMNFLIASAAAVVYALLWGPYLSANLLPSVWSNNLETIFRNIILLNAILGFFNLIPIPPLDGSKVIRAVLPGHMAARYDEYASSPIIMFVFLALMFTGAIGIVLVPFVFAAYGLIELGIIPASFSLVLAIICNGLLMHSINSTVRGEAGGRTFTEGIRWLTGCSFVAIGGSLVVVALSASAFFFWAQSQFQPKNTNTVTATLVERRGVGTTIETAVLEFVDGKGNKKQVEVNPHFIDSRYPIGATMTLSYNPEEPEGSQLKHYEGNLYIYEILIACFVFSGVAFYVAYKIIRR